MDNVTVRYEPQTQGSPSEIAEQLPGAEVLGTLQQHWPDLQRCYAIGANMDKSQASALSIRFTIFADGSLANANATDAVAGSGMPGFASCVAKALRAVKFDPIDSGRVLVTYQPEVDDVEPTEVEASSTPGPTNSPVPPGAVQ